jgi:hypothetical protein
LSDHQDIEHLLTKCFLFPKRLNIKTIYGRYVLIYHHESDANKDMNIVGCEIRPEDQFGALRAKTLFYAKWIRDIEAEELKARQLKGQE